MIITVHAHVKDNGLRLSVPQAGMRLEAPAMVACTADKRRIVAVGRTAEEMMLDDPENWSSDIAFYSPFDPQRFDPELAVQLLLHYASVAQDRIRLTRSSLLVGRLVDRFVYNLWLVDYAGIPEPLRERFEQAVQSLAKNKRLRFRRFLLNGRALVGEVEREKGRRPEGGERKAEGRGQKLEVESQRPEAGGQKPETGSKAGRQRPKDRRQEAEAVRQEPETSEQRP